MPFEQNLEVTLREVYCKLESASRVVQESGICKGGWMLILYGNWLLLIYQTETF